MGVNKKNGEDDPAHVSLCLSLSHSLMRARALSLFPPPSLYVFIFKKTKPRHKKKKTLAKTAKMIPVMIWGTLLQSKTYKVKVYFFQGFF
jgi:hypothetical protein